MKLHLFRCECSSCGKVTKVREIPGGDFVYGELLMRTRKDDIAYLDAIRDKAFQEMKTIFRRIVTPEQLKDSDLFQTIFSVACDPSPEGLTYHIPQELTCPNCGSGESNIKSWRPTNPPEIIEQDVQPVTHEKWNKLSDQEKELLVREAINDYFPKKK